MIFPDEPSIYGFFIDPRDWKYIPIRTYSGQTSALKTRLVVPAKYASMNLYNYAVSVKGWLHFSYHQNYGGVFNWADSYIRRYWTVCVSSHYLPISVYRRTVLETANWLQDQYEKDKDVTGNTLNFNLNYAWVDDSGNAHLEKHSKNIISPIMMQNNLGTIKWKAKIQ